MGIKVKDSTANSMLCCNLRFYLGLYFGAEEVSYRNPLFSETAISRFILNDVNFDPILIIGCHF